MKLSSWIFIGMIFSLVGLSISGNIGADIGAGLFGIAIAINEKD